MKHIKHIVLLTLLIVSAKTYGEDILNYAENGDLNNIKKMIQEGTLVNAKYEEYGGRTVLMQASLYGHIKIIEYLIDNGADINIKDNDGTSVCLKHKTALAWATEKDAKKIVKYLQSVEIK